MILLCLFCFMCLITVTFAADDAGTENDKASITLQDDFSRIMLEIRAKSPVLYRKLQSMPREQALRAMFRAMNSNVMPEKEYVAVQKKNKTVKPQFFYGYLPDKRLFYVRADRLDYNALRNILLPHNKYSALILDLRTAMGSDYDPVLPLLHFLRSKNVPTALLISSSTTGAAELFCALAAKDSRFLLVGHAGSGHMFPLTKVSLRFGVWHIPVIEEKFASVQPGRVKPKVYFSWRTRITRAGLKDPNMVMRDGLLTFASDFLVSRLVLRAKK